MITILLLACGGTSTEPTPEPPARDPKPADAFDAVRERLSDDPPPLGEAGKAYVELAKELGVSAIRCPVPGSGRIRRVYGTPRDRSDLGISYRIPQQGEDPAPWSPYFDEVPIEDGWTVFLAQPGSTGGYLRAQPAIQRMSWSPPAPGEVAICASIEAVGERVVTGRIEPVEDGFVDTSCSEERTALGKDGTFVVEVKPPCSLWVVSKSHRTSAIPVPADTTDKLQLGTVELDPDPYQADDGTWTEAGREKLTELIALAEADRDARRELIEQLEGRVSASATRFWRATVHAGERDVTNLRKALLTKPGQQD